MELNEMILGFLDWKDLTGYELKKMFADLDFIPWSGNNNQVYKALVQLEKEGLVEKEVIQQENYPAQKRYRATEAGRQALRNAVGMAPDGPSVKDDFLLHLCWSHCLSDEELLSLIDGYQRIMESELATCREMNRRKPVRVQRNAREEYVWSMIARHREEYWQNELNWLTRLRNGLSMKGESQ